jgi:uncharacterized protein YkwD
MAIGAIAGPVNKRYIVTSIDLEIETVTVYVTATAPAPVPTPIVNKPSSKSVAAMGIPSKPVAKPTSVYIPVPEETSVYTPAPAPTSVYVPVPEETSVYTPAPVTSSEAPASSAPAYSDAHPTGEIQDTLSSGPDYQAAVLFHHNAARANHGAGPLVWDDSCTANAKIAAENCDFKHFIPEDAGQGQNLFTVSGDSFNVTAGITESWYKGEFAEMTNNNLWGADDIPTDIFHSVGHLTQMLWKETTKVGCVSIDCGPRMKINDAFSELNKYTVCNYASPGNVVGAYAKNVGEPLSRSILGSWMD